MRVLVIGAGIIGSIYGWALSDSGLDVVHLVRRGKAAALRDGLMVDMLDLRKGRKRHFHGVYKLAATKSLSPADGFELVIVRVKHYALAETLGELVLAAGECRVPSAHTKLAWHGGDRSHSASHSLRLRRR